MSASTCILALVDPLGTDFNLGTDEVAVKELPILDVVQLGNFLAGNRIVHLARFLATLLPGNDDSSFVYFLIISFLS